MERKLMAASAIMLGMVGGMRPVTQEQLERKHPDMVASEQPDVLLDGAAEIRVANGAPSIERFVRVQLPRKGLRGAVEQLIGDVVEIER